MNNTKIFITGTMRTGSSLVANLLSVHSKIRVISDGIHFFRFIYKRYDPLDEKNLQRLLLHLRARLYHRFEMDFDVPGVSQRIIRRGVSYPVIYDEVMTFFLKQKGEKEIWGDDPALQWREIPDFINMFPEGRVVHILRDPRAVMCSWKRAIGKDSFRYLHSILNSIDCLRYAGIYSKSLNPGRYFLLRYEDMVADPEKWVKKLCAFIGVEFEKIMLEPERWNATLGNNVLELGRSSFDGNVVGFSVGRANRWRDVIEDWELCLAESLLGGLLAESGYEPSGKPLLPKNFIDGLKAYLLKGEGVETYPSDPTDYRTWGVPQSDSSQTRWFRDTPQAAAYIKEMEEIEGNSRR